MALLTHPERKRLKLFRKGKNVFVTNTTGYYLGPVAPPSSDGATEFLMNRPGPDPIKGFWLRIGITLDFATPKL